MMMMMEGSVSYQTTDSSRTHPARGRRKAPTAPGNPRKATDERPALGSNPRLSRLSPEGRVELCKPEVTGSIPVRSIFRTLLICRSFLCFCIA
jgi:hypothetical protein